VKELALISRLLPLLPTNDYVVVGAGDDCAVLDLGDPESHALFKTDAVVEGIHFTPEIAPERIGHKAIGRCLSDVAAMGGLPIAAVVTLGLPREYDPAKVLGIYRGLGQLAARYQVAVVGGETTTNPGGVILSVALLGHVARDRALLRSGASAGDAIFVTGDLGGSIDGKHLDFEPRLAEGVWLAENFRPHAMIDVSDGLAADLGQILVASGDLGAELLQSALPISRAARVRTRSTPRGKPPHLAALTDGEDFELLFTVPSRVAVQLQDAFRAHFPAVKLSCVGKVVSQPGIRLRSPTGWVTIPATGYQHFA
jgi:thiamine-monophosphate kinase